jgi:hypothetical protein
VKLIKFGRPALYLRNDPDAGWTLAVWKWRLFFNVAARPKEQP